MSHAKPAGANVGVKMIAVQSPTHRVAATSGAADEWVQIPTPGDHYSPKTGSAVITIISEINRCHLAANGKARVLVAANTWDGYDDGARQVVNFPRIGTPSRLQKVVDRTIGAVFGRRLLSGRPYAAAAEALGPGYDGVVFVHNEPAAIEEIARLCPNARVCLWAHNQLFRTYTRGQSRRLLGFAHRIICCSNFIRERVAALTGESPKLVAVLNGVNPDIFSPADHAPAGETPVILFVGRMVRQKGPDVLLRAGLELKRRGIRFTIRLVGSSGYDSTVGRTAYEEHLRELATELAGSIEFAPACSRSEIVSEYRRADILCVPSSWDDPCPLTVLEGMSCGLAVVGSNRGGIPEEGGQAMMFFNSGDHQQLASCLATLLSDAGTRLDMGIKGRRRALTLSWTSRHAEVASAVGFDPRPGLQTATAATYS